MSKHAKTFFAAAIALAVLLFLFSPAGLNRSASEKAMEALEDAAITYEAEQMVDTMEDAPKITNFESDGDAIEALKRCEAEGVTLKTCVHALQENYVVTGLEADKIARDGFEGFMVFPLADGETVILDYNAKDPEKQFIYFGDVKCLQEKTLAGEYDKKFTSRVNAVTAVVPLSDEVKTPE